MPSWVEGLHQSLLDGRGIREYQEVPSRLRRLTIDEAIILQTFPENYEFIGPKSKIFTQIGNAVPCKLAQAVTETVKQELLDRA
ncbi:DNA cytosine methyltransferase [Acetobacter persici]|uniref:DNA cytosine methyltransferase n=1 Tax=Acetobacter persici TaxID=1076596 RepID=UPI001FCB48FD|nr:DNA cytosine methyltransferase [Acetobacter persici]